MHATAHVPFEKRAASIWIDIDVLLIAFDDQFVLAVLIEVREFEVLPVPIAKAYPVSGVFCLDEVVIDRRAHMVHKNATKKAMPVGIVGLPLPQLDSTGFFGCTSYI